MGTNTNNVIQPSTLTSNTTNSSSIIQLATLSSYQPITPASYSVALLQTAMMILQTCNDDSSATHNDDPVDDDTQVTSYSNDPVDDDAQDTNYIDGDDDKL